MKLVTVRCDGARCREATVTISRASEAGWFLGDERDLCPRCVIGKCGGTVGTRPSWMSPGQFDPCACVLPLDHEGGCRCSHDLTSEAPGARDSEYERRLQNLFGSAIDRTRTNKHGLVVDYAPQFDEAEGSAS